MEANTVCVCVRAHKSPHFLKAVLPFLYSSLYVGYVSFWISLPFRKVCLYADIYANSHTDTLALAHRHTRTGTHVFMEQIRPHVRCHVLCQRVCISTICAVLSPCLLPKPLSISSTCPSVVNLVSIMQMFRFFNLLLLHTHTRIVQEATVCTTAIRSVVCRLVLGSQ